jgi:thymidine phosphorylase
VAPGETLAVLHVNRKTDLQEAEQRAAAAFLIGQDAPSLPPLIYEVIA